MSVADMEHVADIKTQSRDSNRTYVHMNQPRVADLFEDFCKDALPDDDIYVPPQHQPINPEDEDDGKCASFALPKKSARTNGVVVVPDQHAAFGITRATKKKRVTAWKDLGLEELMRKMPKEGEGVKSRLGSKPPR